MTLTDLLNGRPQLDPDAWAGPPDEAWADGWERKPAVAQSALPEAPETAQDEDIRW